MDDEESIREIAQVSLETLGGWEVRTAASAQEGLELAAAQRPDAILLDVMMPGIDGPALVVKLQQMSDTRSIPVVFLTAKVQGKDRRSLESMAGVSGLLAKPFDPMTLAEDVSKVLGWTA